MLSITQVVTYVFIVTITDRVELFRWVDFDYVTLGKGLEPCGSFPDIKPLP